MTDFDADEPVAPPTAKRRFWTTDRIIGWSGALIATVAAFFPWYVFFNEDKFGIDMIRQIVSRDLPEWAGRAVVNVSPSAIGDRNKNKDIARSADEIVTGSVPDPAPAEDEETETAMPAQPLPVAPRTFRLLHVAKGQAMIEDTTGVYVVRPGDFLPDQSKVAVLEQRDGEWVIVTDKGAVYGAKGELK